MKLVRPGAYKYPNYRVLLSVATVMVALASLTVAKRVADPSDGANRSSAAGKAAAEASAVARAEAEAAKQVAAAGTTGSVGASASKAAQVARGSVVDAKGSIGKVLGNEIPLVYYWKGDRTTTSPYLKASGTDGNVDEGKAFRALVKFINSHDNDGTTFMGTRINLHGRKIVGTVLEAGQSSDSYAYTAQKIVKEIKPFGAIAAHGSLSAYICPTLAQNGIFNFATYDLAGSLTKNTNGYCIGAGLPWERQVQTTESYLKWQNTTKTTGGETRVYGVIYVEYPGLIESAPKMIDRLKLAGIPIKGQATLESGLATSQQQAPNVVAKFRGQGINTIIMPDAGAPLNFTHAAQANSYNPDYYVWPCSGQDSTAMVRLYNAAQWARASGLTCYDKEFNPDLTNDASSSSAEWYKAYVEATGNDDVPSTTPLVYQGLYQAVVGIANAGPNLTADSFKAGLDAAETYRYDGIEGRTTDATNMLMQLSTPDRAAIADVAKLVWSPTARTPGMTAPGTYVYPEARRYSPNAKF